jgi:hypothetical protein
MDGNGGDDDGVDPPSFEIDTLLNRILSDINRENPVLRLVMLEMMQLNLEPRLDQFHDGADTVNNDETPEAMILESDHDHGPRVKEQPLVAEQPADNAREPEEPLEIEMRALAVIQHHLQCMDRNLLTERLEYIRQHWHESNHGLVELLEQGQRSNIVNIAPNLNTPMETTVHNEKYPMKRRPSGLKYGKTKKRNKSPSADGKVLTSCIVFVGYIIASHFSSIACLLEGLHCRGREA